MRRWLAAGHCGFGLGANADRHCQYAGDYRPFLALRIWLFLVVPMVGAFFIDIVNALVIKLYLLLPIFAQ
nr:glutamate permease [Salmonella sp. NCTC 7297]